MSLVFSKGRLCIDDVWYQGNEYKRLGIIMSDNNGRTVDCFIDKEEAAEIVEHLVSMFGLYVPRGLEKKEIEE